MIRWGARVFAFATRNVRSVRSQAKGQAGNESVRSSDLVRFANREARIYTSERERRAKGPDGVSDSLRCSATTQTLSQDQSEIRRYSKPDPLAKADVRTGTDALRKK